MKRRQFLQSTAAAFPLLISSRALGRTGPGANETVNVGIIGLGGRARDIGRSCDGIDDIRIVSVCDCFEPRLDGWMANMPEGQQWTPYLDFREMIEQEHLDGVMVETTTHARAWVTCHAMAMGMDAYIEKPMALTIAEGREMVNCARTYERVTQVGTQQRSIPLNTWASDLVQNGAIGRIKQVIAPNFMSALEWEPKPEQPMPGGSNRGWWDVWLNQVDTMPYHAELHRRWIWWQQFDGGGQSFGVTGWGTHSYDQAQRGLGTSETGPVEITLEEPVRTKPAGVYAQRRRDPGEPGLPYFDMVKNDSGPRADVRMRYRNGTDLVLTLDSDWGPGLGAIFVGENGTIEINRDIVACDPVDILDRDDRPEPLDQQAFQPNENEPHIRDWVNGIKTRERCNADIEFGQRSTTICYLVNIARAIGRVGYTLQWDPETERFTNSDEANAMLARERRAGYELPA